MGVFLHILDQASKDFDDPRPVVFFPPNKCNYVNNSVIPGSHEGDE